VSKTQDSLCPFGPQYQIYWNMRYSLFSKFDEARVDASGLYTMVKETFALEMAKKARGPKVLDICSGIGSMSVAFARIGKHVTAVEIDKKRVAMAKHNARLYGVADQIDFRSEDITDEATLQSLPEDIDTVFLDPPWGKKLGDYQRRRVTYLEDIRLAGMDLRELVGKITCREVMIRVPHNFDLGIFQKVTGDKVGFTTSTGLVHFYYIRTPKEQFVQIPDRA